MIRRHPRSTLFPYTTALPIYWFLTGNSRQVSNRRFERFWIIQGLAHANIDHNFINAWNLHNIFEVDRKSTRLNSSHGYISYAVFCLKKKIHSRVLHRESERVV